jgi:phosphotransferase system  glucose/maltose/N-acetylglucosamine-specific IIC component
MNNLPLPVRIILNFFIFVVYYLILNFAVGFLIGIFSVIIWFELPSDDSIIWRVVSSVVFFLLVGITITFRKKFYLCQKEEILNNKTSPELHTENGDTKETKI